jgi:exodeoxyribonuclease VII small subunit
MAKSQEIPAAIAKLSFEEALAELEKIVRNLEDGKTRLDEAVSAYERGAALKQHCENKLKEAQLVVEKININADGTLSLENVNTSK